MKQSSRQAATLPAVMRRFRDAEPDRLTDKRGRQGRLYEHTSLVSCLLCGLVSGCRSLRDVEAMTAHLRRKARRAACIPRRISDNAVGTVLGNLSAEETRAMLHRQVKGELRRGQLAPTRLPLGLLAIDGKGLGKLGEWGHANIQKVSPSGGVPYGLARVHRAFLVSSEAAVCVDVRPIPGDTNEMGAFGDLLEEIHTVYAHTSLFEAIITDAGNTSLSAASWLDARNLGYILAIKQPQGEIHSEALRRLLQAAPCEELRTREKGAAVLRRLFRVQLNGGFMSWHHARQLIRVERTTRKPNGERTQGNRYFVSNLPWNRLSNRNWLKAIRAYWRVEDNGNWTADAIWREDARRTPWTTKPEAVYALSALRMLALNIVAIVRAMSRCFGFPAGKPSWRATLHSLYVELASPSQNDAEATAVV